MQPFSLKNATRTQISIRSSITILLRTGVTPATYRLDAFRRNYMKGGLIGTYVYLSFQKPFRESPSSGTSHSRSRGKLHGRNGKTAATKIPPLRWRCCSPLCSLPSAFFSGWCRMPSRPAKATHSQARAASG